MATIFDIAKKAGVSITTVSRALNGYSDVNEKTRQRIVAIAEELKYYPNAAARSLQGKKTNTIAFTPWLRDHAESESFFKEFIGLMALACLKHDLSLLVTVANEAEEANRVYRELAGTGRVDGIILADIKPNDERVALLNEIGLPFVAFGRTLDYADLAYPFVDVDGAAGIEAVVDYLYQQGHRRIAYLGGSLAASYELFRYEGYRRGLSKYGLVSDAQLAQSNLQEQTTIVQATAHLLSLPVELQPTAFVCSNDRLALGTMQALQERGLVIGREAGQLAVTGFDDLPFANYLNPALTTVRQPFQATCETLLDLLVAMLKNNFEDAPVTLSAGAVRLGTQQILLQPELVVRASA